MVVDRTAWSSGYTYYSNNNVYGVTDSLRRLNYTHTYDETPRCQHSCRFT